MLDDADVPVAKGDIVKALHNLERSPLREELDLLQARAANAIRNLSKGRSIRSVRISAGNAGWVWQDSAISDDEWRRRASNAPRPEPPIGIVRVIAPTAHVVLIGLSEREFDVVFNEPGGELE